MIELIGKPLYQWDTGRKVAVTQPEGVTIHEVHFANQGDSLALPMPVENGVASIPDQLLQSGRGIVAYAVTVEDNWEHAVFNRVFAVRAMPRPKDYIYTEAKLALSEIKKITEAANEAVTAAKAAAAAANASVANIQKAFKTGGGVDIDMEGRKISNVGELTLTSGDGQAGVAFDEVDGDAAVLTLFGDNGETERAPVIMRGVHEGSEDGDAVNLKQLLEMIARGGTGDIDLGDRLLYVKEIQVRAQDGDDGFYLTFAENVENEDGSSTAVAVFADAVFDKSVILRNVAPGVRVLDAVNLAQLNAGLANAAKETKKLRDDTAAVLLQLADEKAEIDDSKAGADAWSSKNTVDKLCPALAESGSAVTCEPVEGYPLGVVTKIEPVQAGSGDPSPDNVRPITGHAVCKLWRGGRNILDISTVGCYHTNPWVQNSKYTITETGIHMEKLVETIDDYQRCGFYLGTIQELEGKTITVSGGYVSSRTDSNAKPLIEFYDVNVEPNTDKENLTLEGGGYVGSSETYEKLTNSRAGSLTYTVTGDEKYPYLAVLFMFSSGGTSIVGDWTEWSDIQVEIADTATPYEPYRGETFTLELGQTVYGGSLDWQSGVLTVTHTLIEKAVKDMNNSENYPGWNGVAELSQCFPVGHNSALFDQVCNVGTHLGVNTSGTLTTLFLPYNTYGFTQTEWIDSYPDLTVQVVFPLLEPITVQLTQQEVLALSGTNCLYSDTGDTQVTGRADPKTIIENQQAVIDKVLERVAALEAAAVNNT